MHEEDCQSNPFRTPASRASEDFFDGAKLWPLDLFSFYGRINRSTFWRISIVGTLAYSGVVYLASFLADTVDKLFYGSSVELVTILVAGPAYFLWLFLCIAICIRRLHDRNKAGASIFTVFIPIFGFIWLFIECGCLPGTIGVNEYGPEPGVEGAKPQKLPPSS